MYIVFRYTQQNWW